MTNGFVYLAFGSKYVNEAKISARSLKEIHPDANITIYSDIEINNNIFDKTVKINSTYSSYGTSIINPNQIPYDKNIFIDTDTYVCSSLERIFDMLDEYDLVVTQSPGRTEVPDIPITEYNTGVIGFVNNDDVREFFTNWGSQYEKIKEESGHSRNQRSFTKELYYSNIDHLTLSREYNVRVPRCGYVNGEVKIVHGSHNKSLKEIGKALNKSNKARVYYIPPKISSESMHTIVFPPFYVRYKNLISLGVNSIKKDGIVKTAKKIYDIYCPKLKGNQ